MSVSPFTFLFSHFVAHFGDTLFKFDTLACFWFKDERCREGIEYNAIFWKSHYIKKILIFPYTIR